MTSKSLKRLTPEEAQQVLRRLLAKHRELLPEAERIAEGLIASVSVEGIADAILAAVRVMGAEALGAVDGFRYVHPVDDAWETLVGVVEPHLCVMDRLIALGLEASALDTCKGVLLGLHRLKDGGEEGILAWAPDFRMEMAEETLRRWLRGGPERHRSRKGSRDRRRPPFPSEFVDEHVPEWGPRIDAILVREGAE